MPRAAGQAGPPFKKEKLLTATTPLTQVLRDIAKHTARGFMQLTHNSFTLLGLAVVFTLITLAVRPEIRQEGEVLLMGWLKDRQAQISGLVGEPEAVDRATAANPQALPRQQAAVALWLSKKYSVAPEPLSALVAEAYETGKTTKLDPLLILAVMAIESGFNPFAQSHMGAQGLMQVMTKVHYDKYEDFGGKLAAFDPVSNLRVGAKVLRECINRGGSIEGGLKLYVGATNMEADGGYTAKVLAEFARLESVAAGKSVPMRAAPVPAPEVTPAVEKVASLPSPY